MTVFLLTIAAAAAAFLGGYVAIRSRRRLHLVIALTAGLVLGLVTFDLLPEIFELADAKGLDPVWPMATMTAGFLLFHIIEKFILVHHAAEEKYAGHRHPGLGLTRAAAIAGHSFLDGLSIGVGFQISSAAGTAVAIAVIGHRFIDGFDSANYMLFHQNSLQKVMKYLVAVTFMPVIGGLASLAVSLSETALAVYFGFFAGFLLYIGAGNILPQAHSEKSSGKSIALTVLGALVMLLVTRLA